MKQRMRILALESRWAKTVRDQDAVLAALPAEQRRQAMERNLARFRELQNMKDDLMAPRPFPAGDRSCVVHDEPIFGENNPPETDQLLYHYTRVATLPKIRRSGSLRFRPLFEMNDPHEALESHAFATGLIGSASEPLKLTPEESALFEASDWVEEINAARRKVKVGAFSMDVLPDLADVEPEAADDIVPRRIFGKRGFAHPRMWAQYADEGRGVCLILNYDELKIAVSDSVGKRCAWGLGPVSYENAEHDMSLGFLDARHLLREGASATLLKNFEQSLLTKHEDWSDEAEFRFFVMDGTPDHWTVPIAKDVIAGLIVGPQFDDVRHLRNVRAFARSFGISGRVRRLRWTHGRPELGPVLLS
jgi:hypothetical protein